MYRPPSRNPSGGPIARNGTAGSSFAASKQRQINFWNALGRSTLEAASGLAICLALSRVRFAHKAIYVVFD